MDVDEETLLILVRFLAESSIKEGQPVSRESVRSQWEALGKILAPARPPSPTQRHAIAAERHIDDVCKERDRMARELAAAHESHLVATRDLRRELTVVSDSHRDRLDWFEPNYEGLKRDYDNIKSLNFSSLSMITLGGVLIGSASFLSWDVAKFSALAAGAVATVYGRWAQGLVVYKSPASQERPAVR